MKKFIGIAILLMVIVAGCITTTASRNTDTASPSFFIKPNEPIAIMPFETESALSNLGGQVSDEVIVNLFEHAPNLKIIPATVVRNYMANASLGVNGIPDMHTIHNIQQGLKCRYLLTGNLYVSLGDVRYTQTYSNRIASGSVTVRLIDCDSSIVVWAKHIESSATTTTYYYQGTQTQTTYQTDGQLFQQLLKKLGYEVAQNFFQHN
ncbi:MAG: hypothetical protein AB1600_04260 [Bacteroidota bacterium]